MNYNIDDLRKSLDNIDNAIIFLLSERFRVTNKVGEYKKQNNLPHVDLTREESQFKRIEDLAKQSGLNPEIAKKILRDIIDQVIEDHKRLNDSQS